ncbi:MAG TPA: glycosyltransferase family 4 protein [Pseudobdellovibrionaceae bacterium]|nr:glycosyltransferase family 4 protein [Pseudobdellovibrionaceae bacterium]
MFRRARQSLPKSLNIALISRRLPTAGTATGPGFLRLIARGLALRGHRVTIITSDLGPGGATSLSDGVRIVPITAGRSPRARVALSPSQLRNLSRSARSARYQELVRARFLELHRESPFHVVHSLDASALKLGPLKRDLGFALAYDVQATQMADLFALVGMGQESLGSILGTSFNVGLRFLSTYFGGDRELLAHADGIFVASPRERLTLERYYMYPDAKIHTVPYGIDIAATSGSDSSEPANSSAEASAPTPAWARTDESHHVVVTVSDMSEVGEMRNLLYAFEQVAIRKPNARLIVIGDGPRFKQIEHLTLQLALGSKVIFAGDLEASDVVRCIQRADVFVNLSARTSGFEPSLLEAMARRKLVIGSEVSSISAMIEHGIEGFLVRPADILEITDLMLAVFEGRVDTHGVGEAARAKVSSLFDPEKMVADTLRAYIAVLQATGRYGARFAAPAAPAGAPPSGASHATT